MTNFIPNLKKSLTYAIAIFAGVMLATTSCGKFPDYGADTDGDGAADYGYSCSVKDSGNEIVFTLNYNSGYSGNSAYNTSYKEVLTFTFDNNDICTRAISKTTFESQVYADAYDGPGTKSGKTITIDYSDDYAGLTRDEIRQVVALLEGVYGQD